MSWHDAHRMADWDLDVELAGLLAEAEMDDYRWLCRVVVLAREKAHRLARDERREREAA